MTETPDLAEATASVLAIERQLESIERKQRGDPTDEQRLRKLRAAVESLSARIGRAQERDQDQRYATARRSTMTTAEKVEAIATLGSAKYLSLPE